MEAVIAAFIAAAASIACQLIIARSGAKENKKSQEATERLIIYRIDRLEQTVSEHNALISRMAAAEQKITDKRVLYPHAERDSQRRAVHHSFHRGDIILLWRTDGKKIWR